MPSILDLLLAQQQGGGTATPVRPLVDPFPRNAEGQLINPAAVQTEGARINESLASGTYGNQPALARAAEVGTPAITIAPASSTVNPSDSFFFQPSMWDQNRNTGGLRQELRLDELRSNAALRKAELERQPIRDAYAQAQLDHELAATAAIGATNQREIQKNATTMQHVAGFENYMLQAPDPGTRAYESYVRKGIAKFPAILTTSYGANHIPKLGQEHDITALAQQLPAGFEPTSIEVGGGKQTHIVAKKTGGDAEKALRTDYGITSEQIKNPVGVVVGLPDPNNPTKFKQDNRGTHVAITTGKGNTVVMPTEIYKKFGGKYSGETLKARGTSVVPAGTAESDLVALARKALNDPNSSEEHRAAARKILSP